jgi:hypothetical protein
LFGYSTGCVLEKEEEAQLDEGVVKEMSTSIKMYERI